MQITDNNKIIEISETAGKVSIHLDNLVLEKDKKIVLRIPVKEIAVLVLSNPYIVITQIAISKLSEKGGIIVICNEKFESSGMFLPLKTHTLQSEIFKRQADVSKPTHKRIWQDIIKSKILSQSNVIERLHGKPTNLKYFANRVISDDATNMEAQAAQIYWKMLFKDKAFHRGDDSHIYNKFLNYGYAILRAITTRAICGAGLHPALGIKHHNRYDPFPLASDLMEPFRPMVDYLVYNIIYNTKDLIMNLEVKKQILTVFLAPLNIENQQRSFFSVISQVSVSLANIYANKEKNIWLPKW